MELSDEEIVRRLRAAGDESRRRSKPTRSRRADPTESVTFGIVDSAVQGIAVLFYRALFAGFLVLVVVMLLSQ